MTGQSTRRAPALTRLARSGLFFAPPECVTISVTSGGGDSASLISSAVTALPASSADLTRTTQPPPNREGAVSVVRSPAVSEAAVTSCRSGPPLVGAVSLPAGPRPAAVSAAPAARSTSSSSSPTMRTAASGTAADPVADPERGEPEFMLAACHGSPGD